MKSGWQPTDREGSEVIQSTKHGGETGREEGAQPLGSLLYGGQDRQGSRLDTDGV